MMDGHRKFVDERKPNEIITEDVLKKEYGELVASGDIDPSEETFGQHLENCLSSEGGTLTEIECDSPYNMEHIGDLTRCDCCGNVFTPSRLKVNPENGEKEICPECGEVWCD